MNKTQFAAANIVAAEYNNLGYPYIVWMNDGKAYHFENNSGVIKVEEAALLFQSKS